MTALEGDRTLGTVIIGGGIAGVALAYYLSARGETDIHVVEAGELAGGCTGGSLGGVRQQFSTADEVELAVRGRTFWRTFEETFDYPCAYYDDGYLLLTGRDELLRGLAEAAQVQRASGAPDVVILTPEEVGSIVPWLLTDDLAGGSWTPLDGRVNPTDGVYGLARAARRNGATFHQHAAVHSIQRQARGWRLGVGSRDVLARRVVIAAGLATPGLVLPFGIEIPIRPMMIHYAFTTPVLAGHRLPMTIDLDTGLCLEREQDAAVVTVLSSDTADDHGVDEMLAEFGDLALTRAPIFAEVGIRATMSAAADATGGDGHPYLGEIEPGLWVLAGFDGHGTMQGPAIADLAAGLMAGERDAVIDESRFDPRRPLGEADEWLRAAKK